MRNAAVARAQAHGDAQVLPCFMIVGSFAYERSRDVVCLEASVAETACAVPSQFEISRYLHAHAACSIHVLCLRAAGVTSTWPQWLVCSLAGACTGGEAISISQS